MSGDRFIPSSLSTLSVINFNLEISGSFIYSTNIYSSAYHMPGTMLRAWVTKETRHSPWPQQPIVKTKRQVNTAVTRQRWGIHRDMCWALGKYSVRVISQDLEEVVVRRTRSSFPESEGHGGSWKRVGEEEEFHSEWLTPKRESTIQKLVDQQVVQNVSQWTACWGSGRRDGKCGWLEGELEWELEWELAFNTRAYILCILMLCQVLQSLWKDLSRK